MILVTVGTIRYPFHRLVVGVNKLIKALSKEDWVIQSGFSNGFSSGSRIQLCRFYPHSTFMEHLKKSKLVIAHAGEGTVIQALALQKRLIVVPRNPDYGEHVDNQQLQVALELRRKRLAEVVAPAGLIKVVRRLIHKPRTFGEIPSAPAGVLIKKLTEYVEDLP